MMVELIPDGTRKSFYGKAKIEWGKEGITLYSYNTPVLMWDGEKLHRLWSGWSATTQRHANAFLWHIGRCQKISFVTVTKAWWNSMPVEV